MLDKFEGMPPPETRIEHDAVGTLLALAGSFVPAFDLSKLPAPPGRTGSETKDISSARARYQMLIDQLPAATFMAWFENGRSELYVSSYIETLLGYTAAEWADSPILWYQRLHPEDRERWNEEFSSTVSFAQPFKGDYRFLAKDGRVVWIHGEAKVMCDESGRPCPVSPIRASERIPRVSRCDRESPRLSGNLRRWRLLITSTWSVHLAGPSASRQS
jgi:PAS domain S-box-containing protein